MRAKDLALVDHQTDAPLARAGQGLRGAFLTSNDVVILVDGRATFDSIFAGIAAAKTYLLVQFYIVRDDALGQELAERLIERANAGVRVSCYITI
ncbi:MAG: hypothetical protein MO852_04830 [Candidatus Devosia euplotis]|nr:hypothetical protein [Candidatus Devosia euplotis]